MYRIFSLDWRRMGPCALVVASALHTVQSFALCALRFPCVQGGHFGLFSERNRRGLRPDDLNLMMLFVGHAIDVDEGERDGCAGECKCFYIQ